MRGKERQRKRDARKQTVFTTGEAAELAKVSIQTIIRCFDAGQLKGFRVPGSRFRRIPRECLIRFMKDNGIPLGDLSGIVIVILDESGYADDFVELLTADPRFEKPHFTAPGFDFGMTIGDYAPNLILCCISGACKSTVELLRRVEKLQQVKALLLNPPEDIAQAVSGDERIISLKFGQSGAELYERVLQVLELDPVERF